MIVFTITNTTTEQIYVGTSREDIDRRWEVILKAAEAGVEAHLYDDIREYGIDSFAVSEWAFAEDTAELRELMQAALEETGGTSLQGLKLKAPKAPRRTKPKAAEEDLTRDALLNLEEQGSELLDEVSISTKDQSSDDTAEAETTEQAVEQKQKKSPVAIAAEEAEKPRLSDAEWAAKRKAEKLAYDERQDQKIKEKVAKERAAAREMALLISRMDARGKKPKKTAAKKSAATKSAAKSSTTTPAKSAAALPTGRVNSAAKEKKIREAIAQEKDARMEERQAQQRAEAAEMAALIARLDSRASKPKKAPAKAKAATKSKVKTSVKSDDKPQAQPDVAIVATEQVTTVVSASVQPIVDAMATDTTNILADQVAPVVASVTESSVDVPEEVTAFTANRDCVNANGKQVVVSQRKTLTLKRRQRVADAASEAQKPTVSVNTQRVLEHNATITSPVLAEVSVTAADAESAASNMSLHQQPVSQPEIQPEVSEPKPVSAAEKKLLDQLANQDAETTEMAKLIAKVAARKASLQATRRASTVKKQAEKPAASDASPVGKEQRLRQLVAEEKAKRQAKKSKSATGQSDEMALLMARLEEKRAKCRS
ncbi:hypothetical protein [Aliamphritea ceti]|uniref:hypothetical protein n=1 Tax=Aliamphritea ceti TaxID=1524258 RepID=UPI0021C3F3B0|nr:hypothetical protein [Aliamphritea ceti]